MNKILEALASNPVLLSNFITGIVGALGGLATLAVAVATYLRSKANGAKLDHNTELTKQTSTKIDDTATKLDQNTALTQQIAQSTGAFPSYKPTPKDDSHA